MIEKFLFGMSEKATGPWHKASVYASSKVAPIEFDPAQAKNLLEQAGWKDSDKNGILDRTNGNAQQEFRFTLLLPSTDAEKYFTIYKEDLKKSGIDMQ